jgi:hypothetical protein
MLKKSEPQLFDWNWWSPRLWSGHQSVGRVLSHLHNSSTAQRDAVERPIVKGVHERDLASRGARSGYDPALPGRAQGMSKSLTMPHLGKASNIRR